MTRRSLQLQHVVGTYEVQWTDTCAGVAHALPAQLMDDCVVAME